MSIWWVYLFGMFLMITDVRFSESFRIKSLLMKNFESSDSSIACRFRFWPANSDFNSSFVSIIFFWGVLADLLYFPNLGSLGFLSFEGFSSSCVEFGCMIMSFWEVLTTIYGVVWKMLFVSGTFVLNYLYCKNCKSFWF